MHSCVFVVVCIVGAAQQILFNTCNYGMCITCNCACERRRIIGWYSSWPIGFRGGLVRGSGSFQAAWFVRVARTSHRPGGAAARADRAQAHTHTSDLHVSCSSVSIKKNISVHPQRLTQWVQFSQLRAPPAGRACRRAFTKTRSHSDR